ncbi:hypothetical protein [Nonomuraea dietziae]|uniref:hypothetical protein n=1 Tax=Nonomuraea dietziae TaxID=65515 RepID=UPI0034314F8A
MVVSFMIRGSFALAPPLMGGLTPATNTTASIRHRLPDFFDLMPRIRDFKDLICFRGL